MRAFVLIDTAVGKIKDVLNALSGAPGIKSADACTGPHDIIAVLEASDLNAIGEIVVKRIHQVDGVVHTITCLAVELS